MPACHKCPHQREIERLREICGACPGASDIMPGHGAGTVYLDNADDPERVLRQRIRLPRTSGPSTVDLPDNVRVFLVRLLAEFSMLTDDEAAIVARMLRGQSLSVIARERGRSLASVHACWKRLISGNPHFQALANGGIGLRGGGRKSAEKKTTQGELF